MELSTPTAFLSRIEEAGAKLSFDHDGLRTCAAACWQAEDGGDWFVFCRRACLDEASAGCSDLLSVEVLHEEAPPDQRGDAYANYQGQAGPSGSSGLPPMRQPRDLAGEAGLRAIIQLHRHGKHSRRRPVRHRRGHPRKREATFWMSYDGRANGKTEPQTAEATLQLPRQTARIPRATTVAGAPETWSG